MSSLCCEHGFPINRGDGFFVSEFANVRRILISLAVFHFETKERAALYGETTYVGNLSFETTSQDLEELFSRAGIVQSVKLITDRTTGQSKGFGFVEMMNDTEAESALVQLTNANFFGRSLVVSKARPKASRF